MSIGLRRASRTDAEMLTGVFLEARREAMPWLPIVHTPAETRHWMEHVVLVSADVHVATLEGDVVGFVATRDRDIARWREIEHMYVTPARRRCGIGVRLLAEVMDACICELRLHVFQRNAAARAFYERFGFVVLQLRDGTHNEEGEPDVVYRWQRERAREDAAMRSDAP